VVGKPGTLIVAAAAVLILGCGQIRLNRAMERVNDRYVTLFYDIETVSSPEVIASARGLRESLDDPAILEYLDVLRYQRLLGETRRTVNLIIRESDGRRGPLLNLRSHLSMSCQNCHAEYRR